MEYSTVSRHSRAGLVIVIVMGGMLSVFLVYAVLFPPPENETMRGIMRFLIALCGGLFAGVLTGYVITSDGLKGLTIRACGGIAIFVLLMFGVNPVPSKQTQPILRFNLVIGQQTNQYIQSIDPSGYIALERKYTRLREKANRRTKQAYERGVFAFDQAKTSMDKEKLRTAIRSLKIATALIGTYEPYLYLGAAYLGVGEDEQAIDAFKKAIELEGTSGKAWEGLGLAYSHLLAYEPAIKALQKADNLAPGECLTLTRLGYALMQSGRLEDARVHYEEAVNWDKACADAWVGIASVIVANLQIARSYDPQSHQQVMECLKTALAVDPKNAWANELLHMVLGIGEPERAPEEPDARKHLERAGALLARGQISEALKEYRKAELYEPENSTVHMSMGKAYFQLNNFEDAIQRFKWAIELSPNSCRAWHSLGETYERLGQVEEARNAYEKALRINPAYLLAQRDLARVTVKLERGSD